MCLWRCARQSLDLAVFFVVFLCGICCLKSYSMMFYWGFSVRQVIVSVLFCCTFIAWMMPWLIYRLEIYSMYILFKIFPPKEVFPFLKLVFVTYTHRNNISQKKGGEYLSIYQCIYIFLYLYIKVFVPCFFSFFSFLLLSFHSYFSNVAQQLTLTWWQNEELRYNHDHFTCIESLVNKSESGWIINV
jgi:hypothetical protein